MPDDVAYDLDMLNQISLKYYTFISEGFQAPPAVVARGVGGRPNPDAAPVPAACGEFAPRRMRLNRNDFDAHGFTAGCPGCIHIQSGLAGSRNHSEECRKRIEEMVSEDRREKAKDRIDHWVAAKGQPEGKTENPPEGEIKEDESQQKENEEATNQVDGSPMKTDEVDRSREEVVLEEGPMQASENRVNTPERNPPTRRKVRDEDMETEYANKRIRFQIHTPANSPRKDIGNQIDDAVVDAAGAMDGGVNNVGPRDPWSDWMGDDDTLDGTMKLSAIERRILASCIMGVDITRVFRPERVNKLAARFGLVAGTSMDLTNGWDFDRPEEGLARHPT